MLTRKSLGVFCALAALLFVSQQAAVPQTIDNATNYALANQLADELELVRERMGRPYDDSPRLPVSEVSAFELYYSVQALLVKANQLAQELAGASPRPPGPVPSGQVTPADVHGVLEDSLEQIRHVAEAIDITERTEFEPRSTPISETGVFLVVIDIHRQLNLMLREPISDADVFDEISSAVTVAASILSMFPDAVAVPEPPLFDGYRRPFDVYRRLTECIDAIVRVAPKAGVHVMGLSSRRNIPDDIEPGHVYDVARLVTADLAAIARALEAPSSRADLPTPKHIFATEVYAQTGILLRQLEELEELL
jgi:hypothetical protein